MKQFMQMAYEQAIIAANEKEIPVGAVIVRNGRVIAAAHNTSRTDLNMTRHAEINAINKACSVIKSGYLTGCEMYITLEPCPMCMGAIINSRISKLIYAADDFNFGACGGYVNLAVHPYAKNIEIYAGIMREECTALLDDFFSKLRKDD